MGKGGAGESQRRLFVISASLTFSAAGTASHRGRPCQCRRPARRAGRGLSEPGACGPFPPTRSLRAHPGSWPSPGDTEYRRAKATNPDALAAIWWEEMGRTLLALKGRGRLDVLDAYIGKDGLDVTQFLPPKK